MYTKFELIKCPLYPFSKTFCFAIEPNSSAAMLALNVLFSLPHERVPLTYIQSLADRLAALNFDTMS